MIKQKTDEELIKIYNKATGKESLQVKKGRITDSEIKQLVNTLGDSFPTTTGKYSFETKEDVRNFIEKNKNKQFFSKAIGQSFYINETTLQHFLESGYVDRTNKKVSLFGDGLEIAESGILIAEDSNSEKEKGIVYYDIIGRSNKNEKIIIRAKLSEKSKDGKIYFSVSDIKLGGSPVSTTPSSGRRPGGFTASSSNAQSIPKQENQSRQEPSFSKKQTEKQAKRVTLPEVAVNPENAKKLMKQNGVVNL